MTTGDDPLLATIHIAATPAQVYDFLVRGESVAQWLGEGVFDATPGGALALDVHGAPVRGGFVTLEPPRRVVFTWGYQGSAALPPGSSTVEIRLHAEGDGTRVELEHRELPADQRLGHRVGWDHYLARLALAAAGVDPGPDPGMPPVP